MEVGYNITEKTMVHGGLDMIKSVEKAMKIMDYVAKHK